MMIAWLEGQLFSVKPPVVVLNVNGVGYELEAPMPTIYSLPSVGEKLSLFVHMVVREDAQLLYGFAELQNRDIFRELLKISGVGPKVALAILSTFSARDFFSCIASEEVAQLVAVPGIGKKTAERLMVEMKNRFADQVNNVDIPDAALGRSDKQDAIDALQTLGYKQADVVRALKGVDAAKMTSEQIIKAGLQVLSGRVL
jgi:Holliday junction DNA helicase RuvA